MHRRTTSAETGHSEIVDPAFSQRPADVSHIDDLVTRPGRFHGTESCVRISHFEGFKQRPSVEPSSDMTSSLVWPSGSFLEGMLDDPSALHMISLIILCRCCEYQHFFSKQDRA